MDDKDTWTLTQNEVLDMQKIIDLRDRVLKESTPAQTKRLEIEKRVRSNYEANSDYRKHIRNGRYDLISKHTRDCLFLPQEQLETAYYDSYKPRAERNEPKTTTTKSTGKQTDKESTGNEGFYDDTERSTPDGSDGITHESSQHTADYSPAQYYQNTTPTQQPVWPGQPQLWVPPPSYQPQGVPAWGAVNPLFPPVPWAQSVLTPEHMHYLERLRVYQSTQGGYGEQLQDDSTYGDNDNLRNLQPY